MNYTALKRKHHYLWLVFFASLCITWPLLAQEKIDTKAMTEQIADMLEQHYVFPDVAEQAGNHILARQKSGAYDKMKIESDLALALTQDLQSVTQDKHMRVHVRPAERAQMEREDPLLARARRKLDASARNFGFEQVKRLDNNVGYVDMRYFAPVNMGGTAASAAMQFLQNADALIFDMRKNTGGSPGMVQYVCSYLFDEKIHLNSLYWRRGNRTVDFWTLDELPGKRMADVPVYVLTSSRTFSGAEEFTYNLKTRERATIIGETTGGGANPGQTFFLNDTYGIFIPTGRAINPVTKINWEGTGVDPDIAVAADSAFDVAYDLAVKAGRKYRASLLAQQEQMISDMKSGLESAGKTLADGKRDAATKLVDNNLSALVKAEMLGEMDINRLGYDYLGRQEIAMAELIFEYNVGAYPQSSNVYDSLGEAYMMAGKKKLAIQHYQKSLDMDPQNQNAVLMLQKLRK